MVGGGRCFSGSVQTWRQPALSLALPTCREPNRPGCVCLSVLKIKPHTLSPRQTVHGRATVLAWGVVTPGAKRAS